MTKKERITKQSEDFARWYQDVVREADLAENSEVRGCGIIKPYGYKIWELMKDKMAKAIEKTGAENVYFPIFVPIENLQKEASHVEGFSPELAVVTHGGGEELEIPLAVRPTSEAAMYSTYAKWVQSYRDLPMRLNQWNNVVRWEKRPRPFLRWSEFQWQEGHSVFVNEESAWAEVLQMLGVYKTVVEENFAVPVIDGIKSEMEKFAGAVKTTTIEAMSKDGKAIQAGTSHYLGTNFAKAFDVKYLDENGELQYVHQTSWGSSWRLVGTLIMVHGDDNGLRLPPDISPIQIVIIPISKDENREKVMNFANDLKSKLSNFRVKIDTNDTTTPGFKFNHWEVRGVPVRIEIGEKEVNENKITIFRRDLNKRENYTLVEFEDKVADLMKDIQKNLYDQAKDFMNKNITRIESWDEIEGKTGFFEASWCETAESEKMLKERFSMVSRVLPKENVEKAPKNSKCFIVGSEAKHDWIFAKSY